MRLPISDYSTMPRLLESVHACESALTNLDNAQRALLLPAYCTLASNAPQRIRDELCTPRAIHQKYDSVNTILSNRRSNHVNGEKSVPLSNLFLTPALRSVAAPRPPAPRSAPFHHFSATPAHRSAPLHPIFGWLRSALHSDNKVQNIQKTVGKVITPFIVNMCNDKIYSTNYDQCHVTVNYNDYTNRQQTRSPLSPPTVNRL